MWRRLQWPLLLGLIFTNVAHAAGDPSQATAKLMVQVKDYANVGPKTLSEAEQIATKVFKKAGVNIAWINLGRISNGPSADLTRTDSSAPSVLQVHILSEDMANRSGMSDDVMGLAPGNGPGRQLVYVFYPFVKRLVQRQVYDKSTDSLRYAAVPQILGEAIAHELGHVLLNLPSHSQTGIMKGEWDVTDLWYAAYGSLLFTKQQSEVIRTEAIRRQGALAEAEARRR